MKKKTALHHSQDNKKHLEHAPIFPIFLLHMVQRNLAASLECAAYSTNLYLRRRPRRTRCIESDRERRRENNA